MASEKNRNKKEKTSKPARGAAQTTRPRARKAEGLWVVGMGGSAGGLEAFERFFSVTPPDTGMAFVVVQHLDPTRKGLMPELLQRVTKMHVQEIEDGMKIEPNNIYVIPPNTDVSIHNGRLQIFQPFEPRGLRMPIDFFFRALAGDQGERAICVLVSGMGSDGTLGLKSVKEKLGMAMVQDPDSAKYDGMPRSAIRTGLVDYVAPIEELPAKLIGYVKHASQPLVKAAAPPASEASAIEKVFLLLRSHTGHDFSLYKRNTVYRRIERRMSVHQIGKIADYVRYLQDNPHEVQLLFKELLIGVTNFFREPEAFEALRETVVCPMIADKPRESTVRVWVPGCSTGEEAYSVAIVLRECVDSIKPDVPIKIQVFATDIDSEAIDLARRGSYPPNVAADMSPERLERFFTKLDHTYQVNKVIRETVVFAPQNIIMDPPFTKLDLVCCRNLLIYFTPELQKKIVPLFHYSLNPGGTLFLGSSETIGGFSDLFAPVDTRWKIFKRKDAPVAAPAVIELPSALLQAEAGKETKRKPSGPDLPEAVNELLSEHYTPGAVVIDERGEIVYISGRTGKYLEPSPGKAAMNVHVMAREGLRLELPGAIHRAITQKAEVVVRGVGVKTNEHIQHVDVIVRPLSDPESVRGLVLLVFQDVASRTDAEEIHEPEQGEGRRPVTVAELEEELRYTKENLQTTVEEMETSQEELKSANEELQSTNEELQSTNEELTTSKEELQSLNEELTTVNSELQMKVEELTQASNDMNNLLNSTDVATIFLDNELRVTRFTPQATKVISLIQSDAGRPISHIKPSFSYDGFEADLRSVLHTLAPKEEQIETNDGRFYHVRIVPYRTLDNVVAGVVVTFLDTTQLVKANRALETEIASRKKAEEIAAAYCAEVEQRALAAVGGKALSEALMEHIPVGVEIASTADSTLAIVSKHAADTVGRPAESLVGVPVEAYVADSSLRRPDTDGGVQPDETPLVRAVKKSETVRNELWLRTAADGRQFRALYSAEPIHDAEGRQTGAVAVWRQLDDWGRAPRPPRGSAKRSR